jgi:hypothetical protein
MWLYLLAFLSAVVVDSIPIFAPPAWPVLTFFVIYYDLNPFLVILLGVTGTTIGRLILTTYMPWIGHRLVNHWEADNLSFLGERLSESRVSSFVFVFVYSLTPLSTTALFTAAGMARVSPFCLLPPFFLGKLISYSVLILSAQYVATDVSTIFSGVVSWQSIVFAIIALALLLATLFIDWRELILCKHLRLRFAIWNHSFKHRTTT